MRSRSLTGLPVGDSNIALMADPPMSMERVMGPALRRAGLEGDEMGFGVIRGIVKQVPWSGVKK